MNYLRWTLLLLPVVLFLACGDDAQKVREANEAASVRQTAVALGGSPIDSTPTTSEAPTAPLSAVIEALDVREGDCINSKLPEGIDIENVEIVECSGSWDYRVLNFFEVEVRGDFPGTDYFLGQASENCDRRWSNILFPAEDSWKLRDRTIRCIQSSYGLESSEREKLDSFVGVDTLVVGECANSAPETDFALVELVNCDDDWEFRFINFFNVPGTDTFPGDEYVNNMARLNCDRKSDFNLLPTLETWPQGNRKIVCLQDSFGLPIGDPERLERFVKTDSLRDGDCFNESFETGFS